MSEKKPSFQFYPGDWMKDPALRAVSSAARGLWMDMLCLMFESARRGYLQHATGNPVTADQLARMTGCSPLEVPQLLQELEDCGVFSRTEHGAIYSRRLVKDAHISSVRSGAGKKGAQYGHLGGRPSKNTDDAASNDVKTAKTAKQTANEGQSKRQTKGQNNPPSTSSSISSTGVDDKGTETAKPPTPPRPPAIHPDHQPKTMAQLTDAAKVDNEILAWAMRQGIQLTDVPALLDEFHTHCRNHRKNHLTIAQYQSHLVLWYPKRQSYATQGQQAAAPEAETEAYLQRRARAEERDRGRSQ